MEAQPEQLNENMVDNFVSKEHAPLTPEELEDLQWPLDRKNWAGYWKKRLGNKYKSLPNGLYAYVLDYYLDLYKRAKALGINIDEPWRKKQTVQKKEKQVIREKRRQTTTDKNLPKRAASFAEISKDLAEFSPEKENDLWQLLLEGATKHDPISRDNIKRFCQNKYPDQLESIEVVFGIQDFFKARRILNKQKRQSYFDQETLKARHQMFEEITEYQFLITNFILQNSNNKAFCKKFWKLVNYISQQKGKKQHELFDSFRDGILSQVAAFKIMEHLGDKPQLASPKEDAFDAIDMWALDSAVQIKGTTKDKPSIFETKIIAFPAVEVHDADNNKTMYINSFLFGNFQKFKIKLKKYIERFNTQEPIMVQGLLFTIPYSQFDSDTGEPSEEIIKYFEDNLQ